MADLFPFSAGLLATVFVAISIGSLIKGITGLGLPIFAVPALAALTSVEEAVVLMIIPSLGSNLWVVIDRRHHYELLKQHVPFLIGGIIGALAGTGLLHVISDRGLKILLATWLAIYLVQRFLSKKPWQLFHGHGRIGYAVGLLAGTSQGSAGISAQVVAPYFHDRSLAPSAYAFLVAFTFLLFSTGQMAGALGTELFTPLRLQLSLVALIPTLIFTRIGISLANKVPPEFFNKMLLVVFCLLEIKLITDVL